MYSLHNIHFKQPATGRLQPRRSPSPPHSYVEPLSPSSYRPRPIEPSFNYPALGSKTTSDSTTKLGTYAEMYQWQEAQHATGWEREERRGHHRKLSSMDALADAALAANHSYSQRPRTVDQNEMGQQRHFYNGVEGGSAHKRARTEAFPPSASMLQDRAWEHNSWQLEQQRLHYEHERHLEAAAMLVDFSTIGARVQPPALYGAPQWHEPLRPASDSAVYGLPTVKHEQLPGYAVDGHATRFEHYTAPLTASNFREPASSTPSALTTSSRRFPEAVDRHAFPNGMPASSSKPPAKKSRKRSRKESSGGVVRESEYNSTNSMHLPEQSSAIHSSHSTFLPSPQHSHESNGLTPDVLSEHSDGHPGRVKAETLQQIHTPPGEIDQSQHSSEANAAAVHTIPPRRRGWPKGKPRGPSAMKGVTMPATQKRATARKRKSAAGKASNVVEPIRARRNSFSGIATPRATAAARSHSVPPQVSMVIHKLPPGAQRKRKVKTETSCAGCRIERKTAVGIPELDDWISCNGCKQWFHLDCAGFKNAVEVRDVDKYFCQTCEPKHGKTTYVRKSRRAHTSVDYAELQKGVLKTSDESHEHHYIQPIKDGSFVFDPETFPRMRPELLTREFFERNNAFVEPICIPAAWNQRPWGNANNDDTGAVKQEDDVVEEAATPAIDGDAFEYDCVLDLGQDALDMVMPRALTVRKVCNLVGPGTPLDVIDVKTQNSGAKWNLARWADYYESNAEDKPVRNVISLEVSHTKLGRLLRRPKVVRDIDLQDQVWPQEEIDRGKWPKVQYYCLMSIADSYTDFHIDFGGSSVYYHLIKGKKTFFFIPPKPKHLKAYEEWNNNPQQNFTFLPDITKECYRVDLSEGDTMLIPSGWIHAVWTPETSLVIGGNFLTRMSFKNQFKVAEIEKNNETPQKFRYPFFQRLMWWTAIDYIETDPMPAAVEEAFMNGDRFDRELPIWQDFDGSVSDSDDRIGASNARYYSQAELDGLPDLVNFIFRTVMIAHGCLDGITPERAKRVTSGIPKRHGTPLQLAKAFALWVAWKRGNENPPAWAHPSFALPGPKDDQSKKLTAREVKDLERKKAIAASAKQRSDRQAKRADKQGVPSSPPAVEASIEPVPEAQAGTSGSNDDAITHLKEDHHPDPTIMQHATSFVHRTPSPPASSMLHAQPFHHHDPAFPASHGYSPDSMAPATTTTMMMAALNGQHISTPKTSVLGPRRVACDPCRRRRIRCKHKEFVVQASPESSLQLPQSLQSFGASGTGDDHVDGAYDTAVNGAISQQPLAGRLDGATPSDGSGPMPGTNAYLNANIPMALNGVPLFGDAKRGRSKACFDCRKSKRRCIHDEHGNVDPIKAAETPVSRASSNKKRPADDAGVDAKRLKIKSVTPQPAGIHGVLRPVKRSPISEWSNYSPQPESTISRSVSTPLSVHGDLLRPSLDPTIIGFPDTNDTHLAGNEYVFSQFDKPCVIELPSLEQIAADILDMDGGECNDERSVKLEASTDPCNPSTDDLSDQSTPVDNSHATSRSIEDANTSADTAPVVSFISRKASVSTAPSEHSTPAAVLIELKPAPGTQEMTAHSTGEDVVVTGSLLT